MQPKETVIIIQARTGSTRMPSKVILPFYEQKSILEIIIEKLKVTFNYQIIVATSTNPGDDLIENLCKTLGISVFRGNENNVLKRFIDCAESVQANTLIRVCADNPFLDMAFMSEMINHHIQSMADYTSFITEDRMPVIKTHYGVFAEAVELKALKKVQQQTTDLLYLEHVTNYIYTNPADFKLNFMSIPQFLTDKHIRLTLDSREDWDVLTDLYATCVQQNSAFDTLLVTEVLAGKPNALHTMQEQILKFSK